jgi:agmatinase
MINFGGLPEEYSQEDKSSVVILPVPYDGTSTWVKGADKGPEAILEASANMELYDIETDSETYLDGIFTSEPVSVNGTPEIMVQSVFDSVAGYLKKGKFPVILGGEHSVSIGSIKAFAGHYPDLSVLQMDAHTDLRDEYDGSKNNHACVMARAREVANIVQAGIRSMDSAEIPSLDPGRVFFAHQMYNNDLWMDKAIRLLSENVYITIDLDVFDPSIMPSTGTPEPGGLSWYQSLIFFEKLISLKRVVGFDVVELCPSTRNKAPDFMAAKLIYRMLSMLYNKKHKTKKI